MSDTTNIPLGMSLTARTGTAPAAKSLADQGVRRHLRQGPLLLVLFLAACATRPPLDGEDYVWPEEAPSAVVNGAIYQAGRDIALFENATARRIGDIVTVRLVERTDASKSSSTTIRKSTSAELSGPVVAGRPVTANGTEILRGSLDNQTAFDGEGGSQQSNRLTGDITVTVVRRLPNGNLLVRGEKWLTINQGKEYVRIEGVIRPIDVEPDNSVPSFKVAHARIAYGGRGALADANRPGWLARFFNSPWTPF